MSRLPDPIEDGLRRGWQVIDAAGVPGARPAPRELDCDVAIVGTGAGGGISAEILARAGLKLVLIEEGPLLGSRDFDMREATAYPALYQESAARKTRDKSINILQGRCVGGSTTVNWTSCFRTPEATLDFWRDRFGLDTFSAQAMAPWFEQCERRLGIVPWTVPPNQNNALLERGARRLGVEVRTIARNVRGCYNLGYCGTGCPTNAKQSMLVTTLPAALDRGAVLLVRARAERLLFEGGATRAVDVAWLDASGLRPSGARTLVRARHVVVAAGAINSPALLLRSDAPDPSGLLGRRTFLHPVLVSAAGFAQRVDGYAGAPQSLYSDHFLGTDPIDGPLGYKLEAPPIHPVLFATTMSGFGAAHADGMREFTHTHALLALIRDGFHQQSQGGSVALRADGTPELDYPLNAVFFEAARRALLNMAEIQFAAGARWVQPVHEHAARYRSWAEARAAIAALELEPLITRVVSAHVMGGVPMGSDPSRGLVDQQGRYFHVGGLSVHDGSVFPTSIGANPQLSVYGVAARMASALAERLTGRLPRALGDPG
ncbi:MAG: GMC family oxidoreductase [Burkholderiales bacterium]|nr:MAG: GMC family oxidoreductase [Burkholderiales bacterium]